MGTKNNPGQFDCYVNAEPDEPMFVILGRDVLGSAVVRFWVQLRSAMGKTSFEKLEEARFCADSMEQWAREHGKEPAVDRTYNYLTELVRQVESLRSYVGLLESRMAPEAVHAARGDALGLGGGKDRAP